MESCSPVEPEKEWDHHTWVCKARLFASSTLVQTRGDKEKKWLHIFKKCCTRFIHLDVLYSHPRENTYQYHHSMEWDQQHLVLWIKTVFFQNLLMRWFRGWSRGPGSRRRREAHKTTLCTQQHLGGMWGCLEEVLFPWGRCLKRIGGGIWILFTSQDPSIVVLCALCFMLRMTHIIWHKHM